MEQVNGVGGFEGLPEKAVCLGCGYSLRGLVVARCPECGRGFDPGDAATYLTEPMPGVFIIFALIIAVLIDGMLAMLGGILIFTSVVSLFIDGFATGQLEGLLGSCLILGFGMVNFLAFGYRVERLSDPMCRLAIIVNVTMILVPLLLTIYWGAMITFLALILAIIPAWNILTLWMTKER